MAAPNDLVFGAHYDDETGQSFDPDYVRDGAPTTTTSGTPTIVSSGKFNGGLELNAVEYAEYTGSNFLMSLVQTGALSFWIKPSYSGAPGIQQVYLFITDSGSFQNRVSIWHSGSGQLQAYINSSAGTLITSVTGAWSPTSGLWYHMELNWDVTAGATRLFIDGVQFGSTGTGTGTRTGTCDYLGVGGMNGTYLSNAFAIDEVAVFDAVQHTSGFTAPTAAFDMTPLTLDNGSFETADGDTVAMPDGWQLYLASGSWAFADFGPPYSFVESYEYGYSGNEDVIQELTDLDVSYAVFNMLNREEYDDGWNNSVVLDDFPETAVFASFDTTVPEDVEDYEEEWDNDTVISSLGPGDVALASFDTGTPEDFEDYEEEWDNDTVISSLGPGDVDLADFEVQGGTDTVEDYDASQLSLDIPTSGLPAAGAALLLSPTIGARVEFDATAFVGVVKIQTQSKGSGTWVDRSTVTTPSSIVDLGHGYQAVRAYTESLTSGTPKATKHWPALE